jgi:hypothetical protein
MRDVLFLPLAQNKELVLATDNTGGIGLKEKDAVKVDYETIGYFGMRVAMLECLSTGAKPLFAVVYNFCGDDHWLSLMKGVKRTLKELQIEHIPVTGSTESNFSLEQSVVSFLAGGEVEMESKKIAQTPPDAQWAVIGTPLVGSDVLHYQEQIAPLQLFQQIIELEEVYELLPVGSKGIFYEANMLANMNGITIKEIETDLDIHASSGPATCWIVTYHPAGEAKIRSIAGPWFHRLHLVKSE